MYQDQAATPLPLLRLPLHHPVRAQVSADISVLCAQCSDATAPLGPRQVAGHGHCFALWRLYLLYWLGWLLLGLLLTAVKCRIGLALSGLVAARRLTAAHVVDLGHISTANGGHATTMTGLHWASELPREVRAPQTEGVLQAVLEAARGQHCLHPLADVR